MGVKIYFYIGTKTKPFIGNDRLWTWKPTFFIGNERSKNGSNVFDTYPHCRHVSSLRNCPTNISEINNIRNIIILII